MIFISEGMVNLAIGYLASNQNFPAIVPIALRFKTTETSRTFEMDERSNIPPHLIEDMTDEMVEIYLGAERDRRNVDDQSRQEQHEDEEYREWARIWHERHNEEYENARSDL